VQPRKESDCHSAAVVDLCRDIVVNAVLENWAGSQFRENLKYKYKNVISPSSSDACSGGSVVAVGKMKGGGGQHYGR
jgi:hypothetical protein